MYGFRERIQRFMYGRYGSDKLNVFLLLVYVAVAILNVIFRNLFNNGFLIILQWLILAFVLFRIFSRNIYSRRRENEIFNKICMNIKSYFALYAKRIKDIRDKRYRKCSHCKAVVRLPIKRGRHTVTCPRCQKNFKVYIII